MVWPEHPFDESVDDNPAPDDALRVVHHARPVQLHTLNVPNMTTRPTNHQIWPKSKNSVEYREEVWIVYFRPMAEGLVDLHNWSICLNLKTGEIEIDQNRSIETIMWKSVGDVQWRSGEVRGSNYLEGYFRPICSSPLEVQATQRWEQIPCLIIIQMGIRKTW